MWSGRSSTADVGLDGRNVTASAAIVIPRTKSKSRFMLDFASEQEVERLYHY